MAPHEQLIRDIPILSRLPEDDLRALAARGRVHTHPTGAALFREGDPGDSLHIVIRGSVRISVLSPGGEEATLAVLGPGESCGELSLLDGRPRSASAIASKGTQTLVVTRSDFLRWVSQRPRASLALLETLSLRLRRTDEALADLAFMDLTHRLAKRLLDLAALQPTGSRLRITQSELGAMLGVSRESVNKQLNSFAREGWVTLGRGSVSLRDRGALRGLA
jgi:CRP/FNR family cyclic AMP-dependent transcriptional regulator